MVRNNELEPKGIIICIHIDWCSKDAPNTPDTQETILLILFEPCSANQVTRNDIRTKNNANYYAFFTN